MSSCRLLWLKGVKGDKVGNSRTDRSINLTEKQRTSLKQICTSRSMRKDHIERAKIILACITNQSDRQIGKQLNAHRETVGLWRNRWLQGAEKLLAIEQEETGVDYLREILKLLSDKERTGSPGKFTAEQICQIVNVACEVPSKSGLPFSHWSLASLADELKTRNIVESISTSQLHVFLKSGKYKTTQGKAMDTYSN